VYVEGINPAGLESTMNDGSQTPEARRPDERFQALSALMDGAAAPGDAARACSAWRETPEARSAWHVYHLIGDVLRSDELALGAVRDASFLRDLQVRLADEPVVVAPSVPRPPLQVAAARRSWLVPAAVAAGFAALAVAVVATRPPVSGNAAVQMAQATDPATTTAAASGAGPVLVASDGFAEPKPVVANGKLIRDVRLDQYLAAHKQFGGSSALGVPSGFLRSATYDAAER
jgi:sigma-E factor negative regulatory protein RseA